MTACSSCLTSSQILQLRATRPLHVLSPVSGPVMKLGAQLIRFDRTRARIMAARSRNQDSNGATKIDLTTIKGDE